MRRGGFTLLELLVVLAVLGMLMVGLQQGLHLGVISWQRQNTARDALAGMDATDRAIRRLIEQAEPGDAFEPPGMRGTSRVLRCLTRLPLSAALPSSRIAATLLVDDAHRLLLRWSQRIHARPLSPPVEEDSVLLSGVERLVIDYAAEASLPQWRAEWPGPGLPALVRLRLVFPSGDSRAWPAIIAAPMRSGGA